MWLLYFVCYLFFFRYDSMDQFSTHSCVSRNHRQPSETSVPYYTYSPATDRLFWRHVKKKNVPWHILAPRAVACNSLHLRASAHLWHVSAFFCNREFLGISCYKKNGRTHDFHVFCHHCRTYFIRFSHRSDFPSQWFQPAFCPRP